MKQGLEKKRLKEDFSKKILRSFEKNSFNFTDLDLLIDTNLLTERSGEQFKKSTLLTGIYWEKKSAYVQI